MTEDISRLKNEISDATGLHRVKLLRELCELSAFWGCAEESAALSEMEMLASEAGDDLYTANAIYLKGRHYLRTGEFDKSLEYLGKASALYANCSNTLGQIDCALAISEIECKKNPTDEVVRRIEDSLARSQVLSYKMGVGASFYLLAWIQFCRGDYAGSKRMYLLSLDAFNTIPNIHGVANCNNCLGTIERNLGNYQLAIDLHKSALEIFSSVGDRHRIASCYNNMGLAYADLGKYAEAKECQYNALNLTTEINDNPGKAAALGNLSLIFWRQGDYTDSLKYQLEALKIREEIGLKQSIAQSYLMIGNIHHSQGNYGEAISAYHDSLKIFESIGERTGKANALSNLGSTHEYLSGYSDALKYFGLSLLIRQEQGDKSGMANLYLNTGNIYLKLGNADLALRDYKQAIDIYHSLENKSGVAFCLLGIGNAHNQLLEFEEAWRSLQTAYDLGMDIGQKGVVKEILLSITQTSKGLRNYEAALHYYEQFVELDRELTGQEVKTQLANLNFKHKLEQKEKESEIERLKNVELKNALHELKEEKERSDRLLENQLAELKNTALQAQMNPHFVFNSLNAIQHYIWKSDPKKATDYLASFAKLIRLILENSRQSRVSLEKELLALDYYIQLEALRFENEFTYQIICDPAVNKEEIMIPPMILQPFVENAIIHGLHPSKVAGKLTIAIKKEGEDMLLIKVEDNGIGRSGSAQLSASSRPAAHHSLGMQITEQRVEKMNGLKAGKIWVRDLFNKANLPCGTVIEIELPI